MLQITFLQLLTIYQYYKKFEYIVATSEGLFLFLLLTILKGVITNINWTPANLLCLRRDDSTFNH